MHLDCGMPGLYPTTDRCVYAVRTPQQIMQGSQRSNENNFQPPPPLFLAPRVKWAKNVTDTNADQQKKRRTAPLFHGFGPRFRLHQLGEALLCVRGFRDNRRPTTNIRETDLSQIVFIVSLFISGIAWSNRRYRGSRNSWSKGGHRTPGSSGSNWAEWGTWAQRTGRTRWASRITGPPR